MLVNAVKGYKALNNDEEAENFISRAHLLIKTDDNTEESSDGSDVEMKTEQVSDEE